MAMAAAADGSNTASASPAALRLFTSLAPLPAGLVLDWQRRQGDPSLQARLRLAAGASPGAAAFQQRLHREKIAAARLQTQLQEARQQLQDAEARTDAVVKAGLDRAAEQAIATSMVRAELRQRAEALAELEQQLAARQAGTAARQAGTAATTTGQRRTAAGGTPAQPAPQAGAPATTLQRLTTAGGALAGRFAAVITGAGRWGWGWRSGGGPAPAQHQTLAQPASDAATVVAGGQEASQRGQVVPWAGGGGMARAGRPLPPATIIRAVLVVVAEGARAVRESVAAIGSPPVLPLERDATLTTTVPALRAHRAHYERLLGAAQMALMRLQAQNMLLQEASQTAGQEAAWLKRQLQAQQKRTQQASAVHAQLEVYVARVAELERLLQQLQGRQADEADKAAEATRQATEALHENIDALKSQLQEQETSMSAAMFALKQSAVQAEKEAKEAEKEARRSEREALEQAAAAQQRAQGAEQQAQDAKQRARAAEQRNTRVAEQAAELRAARKELEQQLRRVLQEGQQRVATTAERQQAAEREAEAAKQALKALQQQLAAVQAEAQAEVQRAREAGAAGSAETKAAFEEVMRRHAADTTQLRSQITELQERARAAEQEAVQERGRVEAVRREGATEGARLRAQLEAALQAAKEAQAELDRKDAEALAVHAQLGQQNVQLKTTKEELVAAKKEHEQLQAQLKAAHATDRQKTATLEAANAACIEAEAARVRLEKAQDVHAKLQQAAERVDAELAQSKARVAELEEELGRERRAADEHKRTAHTLQQQLRTLQEEKRAAEGRVGELQRTVEAATGDKTALQKELAAATQRASQLEKHVGETTAKLEKQTAAEKLRAWAQTNQLKKQRQAQLAEKDAALTELQRELEAARAQKADAGNAALQQRIDSMKEDMDALQQRLEAYVAAEAAEAAKAQEQARLLSNTQHCLGQLDQLQRALDKLSHLRPAAAWLGESTTLPVHQALKEELLPLVRQAATDCDVAPKETNAALQAALERVDAAQKEGGRLSEAAATSWRGIAKSLAAVAGLSPALDVAAGQPLWAAALQLLQEGGVREALARLQRGTGADEAPAAADVETLFAAAGEPLRALDLGALGRVAGSLRDFTAALSQPGLIVDMFQTPTDAPVQHEEQAAYGLEMARRLAQALKALLLGQAASTTALTTDGELVEQIGKAQARPALKEEGMEPVAAALDALAHHGAAALRGAVLGLLAHAAEVEHRWQQRPAALQAAAGSSAPWAGVRLPLMGRGTDAALWQGLRAGVGGSPEHGTLLADVVAVLRQAVEVVRAPGMGLLASQPAAAAGGGVGGGMSAMRLRHAVAEAEEVWKGHIRILLRVRGAPSDRALAQADAVLRLAPSRSTFTPPRPGHGGVGGAGGGAGGKAGAGGKRSARSCAQFRADDPACTAPFFEYAKTPLRKPDATWTPVDVDTPSVVSVREVPLRELAKRKQGSPLGTCAMPGGLQPAVGGAVVAAPSAAGDKKAAPEPTVVAVDGLYSTYDTHTSNHALFYGGGGREGLLDVVQAVGLRGKPLVLLTTGNSGAGKTYTVTGNALRTSDGAARWEHDQRHFVRHSIRDHAKFKSLGSYSAGNPDTRLIRRAGPGWTLADGRSAEGGAELPRNTRLFWEPVAGQPPYPVAELGVAHMVLLELLQLTDAIDAAAGVQVVPFELYMDGGRVKGFNTAGGGGVVLRYSRDKQGAIVCQTVSTSPRTTLEATIRHLHTQLLGDSAAPIQLGDTAAAAMEAFMQVTEGIEALRTREGRIKATVANPAGSSRGHLFYMLKFRRKPSPQNDATEAYITLADMAGSEDVLEIAAELLGQPYPDAMQFLSYALENPEDDNTDMPAWHALTQFRGTDTRLHRFIPVELLLLPPDLEAALREANKKTTLGRGTRTLPTFADTLNALWKDVANKWETLAQLGAADGPGTTEWPGRSHRVNTLVRSMALAAGGHTFSGEAAVKRWHALLVEGLFINESLNHVRGYLQQRQGYLQPLRTGTPSRAPKADVTDVAAHEVWYGTSGLHMPVAPAMWAVPSAKVRASISEALFPTYASALAFGVCSAEGAAAFRQRFMLPQPLYDRFAFYRDPFAPPEWQAKAVGNRAATWEYNGLGSADVAAAKFSGNVQFYQATLVVKAAKEQLRSTQPGLALRTAGKPVEPEQVRKNVLTFFDTILQRTRRERDMLAPGVAGSDPVQMLAILRLLEAPAAPPSAYLLYNNVGQAARGKVVLLAHSHRAAEDAARIRPTIEYLRALRGGGGTIERGWKALVQRFPSNADGGAVATATRGGRSPNGRKRGRGRGGRGRGR